MNAPSTRYLLQPPFQNATTFKSRHDSCFSLWLIVSSSTFSIYLCKFMFFCFAACGLSHHLRDGGFLSNPHADLAAFILPLFNDRSVELLGCQYSSTRTVRVQSECINLSNLSQCHEFRSKRYVSAGHVWYVWYAWANSMMRRWRHGRHRRDQSSHQQSRIPLWWRQCQKWILLSITNYYTSYSILPARYISDHLLRHHVVLHATRW